MSLGTPYAHSRGPRLLLGEQSGRGKAAKFRRAARPGKRRGAAPGDASAGLGRAGAPGPSRRVSGSRGVAALGPAPSNLLRVIAR